MKVEFAQRKSPAGGFGGGFRGGRGGGPGGPPNLGGRQGDWR